MRIFRPSGFAFTFAVTSPKSPGGVDGTSKLKTKNSKLTVGSLGGKSEIRNPNSEFVLSVYDAPS